MIVNVTRPLPLPPEVESAIVEPRVAEPVVRTSVACNSATTPKTTIADAVFVVPPISTEAVTVKVSLAARSVGVPEIIPFVVSNVKPAGRVPEMAYVAEDPT